MTTFQLFPQWTKLNEGLRGSFSSNLQFANDNVGWTYIYPSSILKTADAGKTWEILTIDENLVLQRMYFLNESIGWIVCSDINGVDFFIQKTTDGGNTWQTQFTALYEEWHGVNSIQALNENFIYATSYRKIISSNDGGENWNEITPQKYMGDFNNIRFLNDFYGMVSFYNSSNNEPYLLITNDGGINWSDKLFDELSYIDKFFFITDSIGYLTGADNDYINIIYKTSDSGNNWEQIFESDSIGFSSLKFTNEQIAYGTKWQYSKGETTYLKSTDGGKSWITEYPEFNFYNQQYNFTQFSIADIYFNSQGKGVMIGNLGNYVTIYTSNNNGNNWDLIKYSCPFTNLNFTDSLNGIAFGGYEIGGMHVVDSYGEVFSTKDGGKNWEIIFETPNTIKKTNFLDENTAFIFTTTHDWSIISKIFKTTDRGKNWTEILSIGDMFSDFLFVVNDFKMIDENNGFLFGQFYGPNSDGLIIVETNDGWLNWLTTFKTSSTNEKYRNLNSATFINSTGWAVGGNSNVVKYTPLNGWQEISNSFEYSFESVFFKDELNGWISASYYDGTKYQYPILETKDGGNTWQEINNFNFKINDMTFIDNNIGIFVGNDSYENGVIFKTSDGGNNWDLKLDNLIGSLYDIEIKDNYIWISGNYG
ncbi:MAG: hypothetical protein KDC88_12680, partial [Ignavibacteriae bacterium]|nr:hypothetical protein [Ignavibacteriota bacterium]